MLVFAGPNIALDKSLGETMLNDQLISVLGEFSVCCALVVNANIHHKVQLR
jgi:hypothetical protein